MSDDSIVAGTIVGEYEIVQQIGVGGMGVVYLAIHPVIGKKVAIKVLRPEVAADEDLVNRFVTEARSVNSIDHQNIIDVFAFGRLDDGRHYYVMEYLKGLSLEDLLEERGRLSLTEAVPILRQVADAVDAAHERHIIHRDLKPDNIFLVPRRSGRFRVVVLDFGIAKLNFGPHTTATGMVMGTPLYMSPEQCIGKNLDHRTDVYAMGTICYRTLAGRLPFDGESVQVVMYQQISSLPPAPSNYGSHPATDAILLRALDKDPAERYESLNEMIADLATIAGMSSGARAAVVAGQNDAIPQTGYWCEITKPVSMPPRAQGKGNRKRRMQAATGGTTACIAALAPIRLQGHNQSIQKVTYCPAGGILASAGDDQTVRLWSYEGRELAVLEGHTDKVEQLCFSPYGHLLASTGADGRVIVWSVYGGDQLRELRGHVGRVNSLVFSPDGEQLISGGADGTVRLWTVSNGNVQMLSGHTSPVRAVAFSPTGRAIASASDDRTVRLWKDDSGQRIVLTGHRRAVYSVSFSPDGQFLASGGHDGMVMVWRVRDGNSRPLVGHTGIVWHVQYSPDGQILASSSSDGTVRLWEQGGSPRVLEGHERRVRESAFSPDGRTLASVSIDGTVRLWDPVTGGCKSILSHSGPARSVAFTPAGDWVASSSGRASLVMTPITAAEVSQARSKTA
ncbi:MAG: protein kinase [Myxococcales bacterium]|nr:protein kinase [Myxococcales bacterium]